MKEDTNPQETREWLDALDDVVKHEGPDRASFLLLELAKHAMDSRLSLPSATTTPFSNTIAPSEQKKSSEYSSMQTRTIQFFKQRLEADRNFSSKESFLYMRYQDRLFSANEIELIHNLLSNELLYQRTGFLPTFLPDSIFNVELFEPVNRFFV